MIRTVLLLSAASVVCRGSGVVPLQAAPLASAQVLAHSSQYFERTFNRLVAAPPVLEVPLVPVAPSPPIVTVEPARTTPEAPPPTQVVPVQPNIAVAIATAQAAPVATILLPPYPFGPPPQQHFGFFQPINLIPEEPRKRDPEPTTTTQRIQTTRQPDNFNQASNVEDFGQGLPSPANQNLNFGQGLPSPSNQNVNFGQGFPSTSNQNVNFGQGLPSTSNQNVNFGQGLPSTSNQKVNLQQYYAPPSKPQKLKTSVEIVPVPLAYFAPPPIKPQPIKYVHTFIPRSSRIIIRPVRYAAVRVPARLVIHRRPVSARHDAPQITSRRPVSRGVEPTTFRIVNRIKVKPPRH